MTQEISLGSGGYENVLECSVRYALSLWLFGLMMVEIPSTQDQYAIHKEALMVMGQGSRLLSSALQSPEGTLAKEHICTE